MLDLLKDFGIYFVALHRRIAMFVQQQDEPYLER